MLDYIIPLPPGTMSGGKPADGLMACPNECGEVAIVRINKNSEIAAYCDGRVTIRKCGARQFSGKFRNFPSRDKETAFDRAMDMGLDSAPQEYIDLFEKSWGAKLKVKAQTHETNIPENSENPEHPAEISGLSTPDNPEHPAGTSGNPEQPASQAGSFETSGQPAGSKPATSGLLGSDEGEIFEDLYGG